MMVVGSSPLARGTLIVVMVVIRRSGLIPARAGNTLGADGWDKNSRAHPRSRGEHS